jgi:hypothetical protein
MSDGPFCRSCRAPIEWARTESGKAIPLDVGEFDNGNIVVTDGIAYAIGRDVSEFGQKHRRRSHFVSCKQAAEWRRAR